ncbi:hypothetical protein TMSI_53170 (plasmid) [Klebsiella quasipneumoniae]|nr:hypothetical protein TMSI_16190 [Klebsiella quasipneumoniae]BBK14925.1 hypothetical protein TMSI_53170 [Klebsiella quasipneumoniae]
MPVQSGELADMTDGHQLKQDLYPVLQSLCEPGAGRQPIDMFRNPTTVQAVNPTDGDLQADA